MSKFCRFTKLPLKKVIERDDSYDIFNQERNVGKNKIAEYPKRVAERLGLSPIGYTGHCWRRTTATLLAETDISLMQFKNAGGWHSDRVCQEYVAESTREKLQISSRISLCPENKKRSREEECSSSSPPQHNWAT